MRKRFYPQRTPSIRGGRKELQILLGPVAHAVECLFYVLNGVGDTEAQISFTECAESRSGEAGDTGIVEQSVGKFFRRPTRLSDVGKHVERSIGLETGESFDLVDSGIKAIAAAAEFCIHVVYRSLIAVQGFDSSNLGEAGGAGV